MGSANLKIFIQLKLSNKWIICRRGGSQILGYTERWALYVEQIRTAGRFILYSDVGAAPEVSKHQVRVTSGTKCDARPSFSLCVLKELIICCPNWIDFLTVRRRYLINTSLRTHLLISYLCLSAGIFRLHLQYIPSTTKVFTSNF